MLIELYLPILAIYIIYRKKMEEYKQVKIHLCHVDLRYKLKLFKVIRRIIYIYINIIFILRQSGFQQQLNQTNYQIPAKGVQRNFSFFPS